MKNRRLKITLTTIFLTTMVFLLLSCYSDLEDYNYLVEPVIVKEDSLKLIVITKKGDPQQITGDIFRILFKTFQTIKRKNSDIQIRSLRIRWEIKDVKNPSNCLAHYGMPVPSQIDSIPEIIRNENPEVKLEKWGYGTIGKVLHIGPYKTERASILKLRKYIKDNDYSITSKIEEEFLKGPGFFTRGDPDEYYTIVRYVIKSDSLIFQNLLKTYTTDSLMKNTK